MTLRETLLHPVSTLIGAWARDGMWPGIEDDDDAERPQARESLEESVKTVDGADAFEPRRYSVTVDAHPHERGDGEWVVGDTTVRIRFYCSATTHVLRWPDHCTFASRIDAERDAYVAGVRWARARYG